MKSKKVIKKKKTEKNKNVEYKDIYKNIKSKYILQKEFNNLMKKKSLDITKYNKLMKDKINININDYKEYSELYSSIEIEIRPIYNKTNGQFINIDEKDGKYFHIYFNKNKKEVKRKKEII